MAMLGRSCGTDDVWLALFAYGLTARVVSGIANAYVRNFQIVKLVKFFLKGCSICVAAAQRDKTSN
jgi:hypothetical protein